MINLLPPAELKQLLLERHKKLTILVGNITIISMVCLALILLSLKFYILQDVRFHNNTLEAIELGYSTPSFALFKEIAQKYNPLLVKMNQFYQQEVPMHKSLISVLEVARPSGVSFITLALERSATKKVIKATITGKAVTRNGLLEFKKRLESSQSISNVSFPPESWTKSSDVNFNVTFDVLDKNQK